VADTHFVPGKFGSALDFDGTGDYVNCGSKSQYNLTRYTIIVWANRTSNKDKLIVKRLATEWYYLNYVLSIGTTGTVSLTHVRPDQTIDSISRASYITDSLIHQVVGMYDGTNQHLYVDGISVKTPEAAGDPYTGGPLYFGYDQFDIEYYQGQLDHIMIFNRALSASEIALLYREPFCMFDRVACNLKFQISNFKFLAGTAAGTSDVTAVLSSIRGLTASTGGVTAVDGSLSITGGQIVELIGTVAGTSYVNGSLGFKELPHEMGKSWLREALFNGMTANAFKLGTSLSLGWFWVRVTGCSVLYRGAGMGEIDFANILTVSNLDVSEISPPSYISHDGSANGTSTYFYVVRRFNNCGYQEHTLAAAVRVSIGSSGELAEPQPNNISSSKVEQVDSNKIRLTWFYCPIEQGSKPIRFNVYYDDRTGQIDYLQTPLAIISYKGRRFYSFQSSELGVEAGEEADEHLFAIRTEDAGGIENISLARLKIQLDTLNPDAIDILRAEAV